MPQLNLEVGIPTVQLVGPETNKEELLEIYLEVYKLHRLPGSPPGELAVLKEVMASLPDSPRCKEEKAPAATVQPHPGSSHFSRGGTPHRRRNNNSMERSLAKVCKALQKVLAMVTTLDEEIERLSRARNHSKMRARSKSRHCQRPSREGQKKRCCQVQFEEQPAPSHSANPKTQLSEEGSKGRGSDLEELPELKLTVASFLRGSPETSEDEGKKTPPEPTILDFSLWVLWKVERCKTPEWWMELSTVPWKDDHRKLSREVRASFRLPWQL